MGWLFISLCFGQFPYVQADPAKTTIDTAKALIHDLEPGLKLNTSNCEVSRLLRINSTHLLPVHPDQRAKCTYILCITSDPAAVNSKVVEELAETAISPSAGDVAGKDSKSQHRQYKWMSLGQLKNAQKTSQLAGLEPIAIVKQLLEGKLTNHVVLFCILQ